MINNIEDFNQILLSKRNTGNITCEFKNIQLASDKITKDQFLNEIGFKPIEIKENWKKVDKNEAQRILEYILSFDMAYDTELDAKPEAKTLSSYFLSIFHRKAAFFTNGYFEEDAGSYRLRGWTPITDSTFDTGILAIDKYKIGILWAEDTD
ncbi:hypothetical protein QNH36_19255 [Mesobacillus sp. AQ2]|uniref:hypothetical protein n=1 Tax=Bacillaceae TaxID=186817 RepID=UPI0011A1C483|nr:MULTISPECIES: hypothetical protein [Bacillaceae]WHX39765.1 hypothetical protein QNH36_19255 [Mesobacillus sp. AQ2]